MPLYVVDAVPETRTAASSSAFASFFSRMCLFPCLRTLYQRVAQLTQWRVAARCLALIIRNVSISSAMVWIAAFVCSRGSPFHGQPVDQQSRVVFVATAMVWLQSVLAALQIINHSMRLVPHCFVTHPPIDRRPGFLYCVGRVAKDASPYTALVLGLTLGTAIVGDRLPLRVQNWKLEYYVACFISSYQFAACDVIARQIYAEETVAGQAKHKQQQPSLPPAAIAVGCRRRPSRFRRIARSFVENLPLLLSLYVTGGYIHLIHGLPISSSNITHMTVFYAVSLAVKLATQEIAKYFIVKSKTVSTRDMCVIICAPTVLIETQVRVVIVSLQSTTSNTVKNTLLMAAVEICLRTCKVTALRLAIASKEKRLSRQLQASRPRVRGVAVVPQENDSDGVQANEKRERDAFEKWRALMLTIHTAETFVDMYAEYLAIGCASAIAYLFAGHSHFRVGSSSSETPSTASESSSTMHPVAALAFQVAVEMIADYVACLLEISQGVDVQGMEALGTFFGFIFTLTAVANVYITAVLYMK